MNFVMPRHNKMPNERSLQSTAIKLKPRFGIPENKVKLDRTSSRVTSRVSDTRSWSSRWHRFRERFREMLRVRDIRLHCSPLLIALFLARIEVDRRAENYQAAIIASDPIERQKRKREKEKRERERERDASVLRSGMGPRYRPKGIHWGFSARGIARHRSYTLIARARAFSRGSRGFSPRRLSIPWNTGCRLVAREPSERTIQVQQVDVARWTKQHGIPFEMPQF